MTAPETPKAPAKTPDVGICKTSSITVHTTHAANISSFGGSNLYKGNNKFVEALYPEVHMNALDYAGLTDPPRDKRVDRQRSLPPTGSAISIVGLVARVALPMV